MQGAKLSGPRCWWCLSHVAWKLHQFFWGSGLRSLLADDGRAGIEAEFPLADDNLLRISQIAIEFLLEGATPRYYTSVFCRQTAIKRAADDRASIVRRCSKSEHVYRRATPEQINAAGDCMAIAVIPHEASLLQWHRKEQKELPLPGYK